MELETLLVDVADGVALVTINRPEVRNAISRQVQDDLRRVLDAFRDDDAVGALVLTGAGDRAFVAGADIAQLRDYDLHTGLASDMQRLYDEVEAYPKPTIAAVNGYALGGGCELAMACDLRIAATSARFGLPETNLSVLPGAGGTQRMARLVGTGLAIDLVLTGRMLTAAEALAAGLVTRVAEPDALLDTAREVARTILAKGPLAVRLATLVIRSGMDADQRTGLVVERLAQALLYTTDDKREGAEAFLAKRTPSWSAR
ncbi:enoyl-CoA hydratase/isomerase family protein [Nocardioides nitrophenolicus]|uniref:enoyl-CoA hydratase/isomerase family protein n=1 Tax=Nocardioides nitrophenolicus TaxID=60489 RepID=UPI00195CC140|nr:enoyl-CoA hydratase-related protein [Nocardioides nitrophenolicus]MBM7518681.1 enoyl-CoA hydratase/carnithine racemase [Nocardioides nitrophenolicus]